MKRLKTLLFAALLAATFAVRASAGTMEMGVAQPAPTPSPTTAAAQEAPPPEDETAAAEIPALVLFLETAFGLAL